MSSSCLGDGGSGSAVTAAWSFQNGAPAEGAVVEPRDVPKLEAAGKNASSNKGKGAMPLV